MTQAKTTRQRNALRFNPDMGAHAEFGHFDENQNWVCEKAAVILNESYTGCGLVTVGDKKEFLEGQECLLKVGPMNPLEAEIVWCKEIDERVLRLGLCYCDNAEK